MKVKTCGFSERVKKTITIRICFATVVIILFVLGASGYTISKINNINEKLVIDNMKRALLYKEMVVLNENLKTIKDLVVPVNITAYPPLKKCTDDTPFITASGARVRTGIIAISKALENDYGLKFGDIVHIIGYGDFEVQDRVNEKWNDYRVDIFMWSENDCKNFGFRKGVLVIKKKKYNV